MIDQATYTKEWVDYISKSYGRGTRKADPDLIEKVTKALHLLESLTQTDLKFIFKGGTSLLILLDKMHRFSIDIDIIVEDDRDSVDLNLILDQVVSTSSIFERYEEQNRGSIKNIPKAHYKVFYNSAIADSEGYVLLDILFEKSKYLETVEMDINCDFIKYKNPERMIRMPSVDCILGDKLTAYAPNTTGIPYNHDKELEIIKQLYDVANLFDCMNNIETVRETFRGIAEQELEYRKLNGNLTYIDILDDIFDTSSILTCKGIVNEDEKTFKLLENGVKSIRTYVFSENYIIEKAVNSASKAAYLSLLLKNDINTVERYNPKINVKELKMSTKRHKLFRNIYKYDAEAYFYWYKSFELLDSIEGSKVEAAIT